MIVKLTQYTTDSREFVNTSFTKDELDGKWLNVLNSRCPEDFLDLQEWKTSEWGFTRKIEVEVGEGDTVAIKVVKVMVDKPAVGYGPGIVTFADFYLRQAGADLLIKKGEVGFSIGKN